VRRQRKNTKSNNDHIQSVDHLFTSTVRSILPWYHW